MSRNFDVQVEVFPCSAEEKAAIAEALRRWGMTIECCTEWFRDAHDGWSFWGDIPLGGGQTEKERHEQLRALLPNRRINTHWRWVDDQPWDEEFSSEPLRPAA